MDPLNFLGVARTLSETDQESNHRTSVGRSYFAVFNHFRLRLDSLKPLPKTQEDHSLVVRYLTQAPNSELKSVGQTLSDLRKSRNEADYDMDVVVGQDQSRLALAKADRAIDKSQRVTEDTLKAAMKALPIFRRANS